MAIPTQQQGLRKLARCFRHRVFIIASALSHDPGVRQWQLADHDDNVAVPIIDRIIHYSHLYMLGGESYRLKEKNSTNPRRWVNFVVRYRVKIASH